MDKRLKECLENSHSTEYILPFFWQHGEDHAVLEEEIDAIHNCGLTEFCVESRTHEQFCKDKWWEDFGFILKAAKARGMRVWLLDDKRFPTGYANNYIASHPKLKKVSLRVCYHDFVGPRRDVGVIAEPLGDGESYVSVVAYKRVESGDTLTDECVQLTSSIKDGIVWWDIPDGVWRVYYVIRTHVSCNERFENYVDKLSPESCLSMIHAVYQPHYDHFSEYFGNTFAGFFSDEPSFSNDSGSYLSKLGKEGMLVPWHDSLPQIMSEQTGLSNTQILKLLPALWHDVRGKTNAVRESYMEAVTKAYSENFCYMLGNWCRDRGVMYIGHIIEDMNTHQRLGYGAGHFFRALDGQDMAGIDIVLNQMIPDHLEIDHTPILGGLKADPEFYNYTLAKLASSHAHIQPLKKNRAMCEIYGAFGWAEGVPMMKYLTDHMLVCGINYFVPHAFTPKYPDFDCPPHFYARGMNSQYPYFAKLMGYTSRMSHLLSGGDHVADVALYYNAEAEWSGGDNMLLQKVCRTLTRAHIDFDILPQDTVCENASVKDGRLCVNRESYSMLIVPYSQYLPRRLLDAFCKLAANGADIRFVDALPEMCAEGGHAPLDGCTVIPYEKLKTLDSSFKTSDPCEHLRFYHVKREDRDIFMLWNESTFDAVDTFVTLPVNGRPLMYDGWLNKLFAPECEGRSVRVKLCPSQAVTLVYGETADAPMYDYSDEGFEMLPATWCVSVCQAPETEFTHLYDGALCNLAQKLPRFGGVIRYETKWQAKGERVLDLGNVGECCEVWINGEYLGARVGKPYRYELGGRFTGNTDIRIDVANNLGYRERDRLSRDLVLPVTGLAGPIKIK